MGCTHLRFLGDDSLPTALTFLHLAVFVDDIGAKAGVQARSSIGQRMLTIKDTLGRHRSRGHALREEGRNDACFAASAAEVHTDIAPEY